MSAPGFIAIQQKVLSKRIKKLTRLKKRKAEDQEHLRCATDFAGAYRHTIQRLLKNK